jgi:hypothetical protein
MSGARAHYAIVAGNIAAKRVRRRTHIVRVLWKIFQGS